MNDRVRELRARLGHALLVFSEPVRRDIEELFALASRSQPARKETKETKRGAAVRPTLAPLLAEILREARGPMRIRALLKAARARGWTTRAKKPDQIVRAVLIRPPFVRARRGAYALAANGEGAPPRESVARDPSSVRARIRALLASAERPMKPGEIAAALLASGWKTRSPRPAHVVSAVLSSSPEFVAVDGGHVVRSEARVPAIETSVSEPDASRSPSASPGRLADRIDEILRAHGSPMKAGDLREALERGGWKTQGKAPGSVISAAIAGAPPLVVVARGVYGLAEWPLDTAVRAPEQEVRPESSTPSRESVDAPTSIARTTKTRASRAGSGLAARIEDALRSNGAPMNAQDLIAALRRGGWRTTSKTPLSVVSAVIGRSPELVAVAKGVYALHDWRSRAPDEEPDSPARSTETQSVSVERSSFDSRSEGTEREPEPSLPPGVLRRADRVVHESGVFAQPQVLSELDTELGFLLQHIEDTRPDAAVLAPLYQRKQITAWMARARAIAGRACSRQEVVRSTGKIAAELGALAKHWWPGSVEALRLNATPLSALAPFVKEPLEANEIGWELVADRLDAQLESAYDDPHFDDGWSDTRWLCDDERFATSQLDHAETLLARAGLPIAEPPPARSASLPIGPKELRDLIAAARGLRWIRGVATDGLRWGRCMGRMRFIASTHPLARESQLPQILSAEYSPLGAGWGFDEEVRDDKRQWLTGELTLTSEADLPQWFARAINVFDNPDLATLLSTRRGEVSRFDPGRLETRRARSRLRKLVESMGIATVVTTAPSTPEPENETESVPRFATARALLAERFGRARTLFISNRVDRALETKLAATFDLDLEWCVATPRRVDAAAESIRNGKHDLVLSATGFQNHSMDAAFSRAAHDSSTPYIRVNRGRPSACARAIARQFGGSGPASRSFAASSR